MDSVVNIWDLDVVNAVEPIVALGGPHKKGLFHLSLLHYRAKMNSRAYSSFSLCLPLRPPSPIVQDTYQSAGLLIGCPTYLKSHKTKKDLYSQKIWEFTRVFFLAIIIKLRVPTNRL